MSFLLYKKKKKEKKNNNKKKKKLICFIYALDVYKMYNRLVLGYSHLLAFCVRILTFPATLNHKC